MDTHWGHINLYICSKTIKLIIELLLFLLLSNHLKNPNSSMMKNVSFYEELKKEQAKLQEQHQTISIEIRTKMEAIRKLQEVELKFEEKIRTLEDEFQKENEKNLKIMDDLDNYDKIISCITSVSQED